MRVFGALRLVSLEERRADVDEFNRQEDARKKRRRRWLGAVAVVLFGLPVFVVWVFLAWVFG